MEEATEKALERIADRVLKKFKNDYVLKYAYIDNPKKYERTMDFLNAWDWTPLRKEFKTLSKTMWYNPGKVHPKVADPRSGDEPYFQHGSIYSRPEIVIASLMEILDKKGRSSSLWLSNGVNRKEAYFQKFLEDFFDGGMLSKIVSEEFIKVGFRKI
jgi:hypothetical protein